MKSFLLEEITFEVTRKPIKNLYLRVPSQGGAAQITAPLRLPEDAIRSFALSRLPWVRAQRQRLAARPVPPPLPQRHTVPLWGQSYPLLLQPDAKKAGASFADGAVTLCFPGEATEESVHQALCLLYKSALAKALPGVIAKCEQKTGLHAASFRLRDMRTRWGSCNVREARICLNVQLAAKPPECLAYVLTHELCHLLEKGHNARFYRLMDSFSPGWREVKARLNAL